MFSIAFKRKQSTQTFLVINKKKKSLKNNNLTVFEPKAPLGCSYETDTIPLSQTATFNI